MNDSPNARWDGLQTVLHKETLVLRRQMRAGWRIILRMLFLLAFLGWMGAMALPSLFGISSWDDDVGFLTISGIYVWLPTLLLLALVLPSVAAAIAHERKVGSLEMLLLTPLSNRDILLGKLLAPLAPYLKLIGIATAAVVVVLAVQREPPLSPLLGVLNLLAFILYAGTLALYASTTSANTGRAIGMAVTILFLLNVFSFVSYLLVPLILVYAIVYGLALALTRVFRFFGITVSVTAPSLVLLILVLAGFTVVITRHVTGHSVLDPLGLDFLGRAPGYQLIPVFTLVTYLVYARFFYWLAAQRLEKLRHA